jgi:hypothetical protein
MANQVDAQQLWEQWTDNRLGQYKDEWIAFQNGQVLAHGTDLLDLSEPFASEIATGSGPLFAFITFGILA